MEVEVILPSPPVEFNFDSASTSPYITAPSSPQRFGTFYYSAPTSPTRVSAIYGGSPTGGGGDTTNHDYNDAAEDFAFDFSGQMEKSSLPADELFDRGKIKPLKPPPSLEFENNSDESLKAPQLPPRLIRKKEFDQFPPAVEESRRANIQELSRRTKSLSPFRVSDLLFDGDNNQVQEESKNSSTISSSSSLSSSSSSSSSLSSWYKKWKIKDLLLFRSASESRVTEMKKYEVLKKNCNQDHDRDRMVKNCSVRSTDSVGSGSSRRRSGPSVSAHELHYTANRAASEEMKRRTFLPYKQGLLGCLGFNPNASLSRG